MVDHVFATRGSWFHVSSLSCPAHLTEPIVLGHAMLLPHVVVDVVGVVDECTLMHTMQNNAHDAHECNAHVCPFMQCTCHAHAHSITFMQSHAHCAHLCNAQNAY